MSGECRAVILWDSKMLLIGNVVEYSSGISENVCRLETELLTPTVRSTLDNILAVCT